MSPSFIYRFPPPSLAEIPTAATELYVSQIESARIGNLSQTPISDLEGEHGAV